MLHSDRTDFSFSLQIRPFFGRSMRSRPFAHAHLRTVAAGASSLYPANHRKLREVSCDLDESRDQCLTIVPRAFSSGFCCFVRV